MIEETELCKLAFKYGTDKCPQLGHSYTPYYYKLFKDKRHTVKKLLELGIGSRDSMYWVPDQYQTGASLLMWRDFFPNSTIYGVDIDPTTIFQADRISTFLLDTRDELALKKLIDNIGADIDIIIDDGNHNGRSQMRAARAIMPLVKKDCIYIIEDAKHVFGIRDKLATDYDCQAFKFKHKQKYDSLVVIKNK